MKLHRTVMFILGVIASSAANARNAAFAPFATDIAANVESALKSSRESARPRTGGAVTLSPAVSAVVPVAILVRAYAVTRHGPAGLRRQHARYFPC